MANRQILKHYKTSGVTSNAPKLPNPSNIQTGELAINYAKGYETLAIKNSSGSIVTFSADHIINHKINQLSGGVISEIDGIDTDLNALDESVVHKAGTETITGAKTFMSGITIQNGTSKCYEYYDSTNECLKFNIS